MEATLRDPLLTTPNDDAVVDRRRRAVAALKLRGLTKREIVDALEQQGIINPTSGRPWSATTVQDDITFLRAAWREDAKAEIGALIAEQLAELREIRRKAWANDDLPTVLSAMDREQKLLGTLAPTKVAATDAKGNDLPAEQRDARIADLIAALRDRAGEGGAAPSPGAEGGDTAATSAAE